MSGSRWMGVQRGLRGGRDSRLLPGYLLRSSSNDTPVLSTDVRLTLDGCAERTARGSVTHPHFSSQAIWRRLSMATPRRSAPCCTACGMSWTFKLPFASKFKIYLAVNQVSYASTFKIYSVRSGFCLGTLAIFSAASAYPTDFHSCLTPSGLPGV